MMKDRSDIAIDYEKTGRYALLLYGYNPTAWGLKQLSYIGQRIKMATGTRKVIDNLILCEAIAATLKQFGSFK